MGYKLIALDLDGTLLTSETQVSDFTKSSLKKLRNAGYIVVIVTGRNRQAALHATDNAEFADYLITDSGGGIYCLIDSKKVRSNTFSRFELEQLLELIRNHVYIEGCDESEYWRLCIKGGERSLYCRNISREDFLQQDFVTHINLFPSSSEELSQLLEILPIALPGTKVIPMQDSFSDRRTIILVPGGRNKSTTLLELADKLGIMPEEIIAFGDGLNDIDLLECAGCGVAMANALPPVKAVANTITEFDNNHDGVARFLLHFLS